MAQKTRQTHDFYTPVRDDCGFEDITNFIQLIRQAASGYACKN